MESSRRGELVESTVGILAVSSQVNTLEKYLLIINGLLALKIPNYFTAISTNTRIHHHQSYYFTHIRTDAYMNSFFHRTIREWNDLPQHVIDSNSLDLFQEQLNTYLNTALL